MANSDIESLKKIADDKDDLAKFRAKNNIISLLQEEGRPSPEAELAISEINEAYNKARKSKAAFYESRDMAGIEYIKSPYFARGHTTVIFGEAGAAKSMLCVGLAGQWTNQGLKVLYINTEDSPLTTFIPRTKANEVKDENFRTVYGQWVFSDAMLLQLIAECKPDVVIWDMLKDMAAKEMDLVMNPADIRRVLTYLNIIAEKLNCCCIATHHSNKAGGNKSVNRVQGSMDWFGKARSVLEVAFDDKASKYNVFHVKANYTRKAKGFAFSIREKSLGMGINGIEVTAPELLWDANMSMTEDDLSPETSGIGRMERAADVIIKALKDSKLDAGDDKYIPSKELEKIATEQGVLPGTFEAVKKDLSRKKIIYSKKIADRWFTFLIQS